MTFSIVFSPARFVHSLEQKEQFNLWSQNYINTTFSDPLSKDYSQQNGIRKKSTNDFNENDLSAKGQTKAATEGHKEEEDSKSAIIEVLPPPAADPINGRYRYAVHSIT